MDIPFTLNAGSDLSSSLPSRIIPVTISELLIVPVRSDQAFHCVSQHPEIMPVAELIELARAAQRFHLWQSRGSLSARSTEATQRQRQYDILGVQPAFIVAPYCFKIFPPAKSYSRVQPC